MKPWDLLRGWWARRTPLAAAPPSEDGAPGPGATPPDPAPTWPARLGGFQVEGLAGQGATGAVLRGLDLRTGLPVALKTLRLDRAASPEHQAALRERFLREAELARRLDHPGIVRVLGAGEEAGLLYLVLEWVEGHDLRPHTRPGALLPPAQVLRIGRRIAQALAHAHRQGIVHRDVKPANILLDARGEGVKLADFGVARLDDASWTRTGTLLGTPDYMAPEQVAGGPVDGRADVYALAAVVHELLTGALPFPGASLAERLRARVAGAPPPVSTLRPGLPPVLDGVLVRALAARPAERLPDADALAAGLDEAAAALDGAGP